MLEQTPRYAFAALLFTCLFVYGSSGHAQEQSAPGDEQQAELSEQDELVAAGKQLTDELQQVKAELAELNKAYAAAKGEEQAILWSQIRAKREALTTGVEDLISHAEKLEATGQETAQYRNLSRELISSLSADLEKSIVRAQQRIVKLREQRSSASPEELEALDKEIEEHATAVDQDLTAYFELTQLLADQEGDPSAQLKFLDGNIKVAIHHVSKGFL